LIALSRMASNNSMDTLCIYSLAFDQYTKL
jgi:hypothetical protein